jgi:beta-ketoacyl-acyl-carrier-protein synthase II
MGTLNSLALTRDETFDRMLEGVSGVGPITRFDPSDLIVKIACEVKGFNPEDFMDYRGIRRSDRFQHFAIAAVDQVFEQSGFDPQDFDLDRIAVIVASAIGGLDALQDAIVKLVEQGPRRISPFAIPMMMANGAAGLIALDNGIRGPCFSIVSACASGEDAIGQAALMIKGGIVDAAIAGASEATISRVGIATFDRLGALSRRNEGTPSPFDKSRDGLVMGEGVALLLLESFEHAKSRGAEILAELAGYGSSVDAFHITAPAVDGSGGALAIKRALDMGKLNPEDVDYVNAHGTGTELNDVAETRGIKLALGEHAYDTVVSSTKSMTGHMMGATGALEALVCVKAIQNNMIPPTINLVDPDPECDLDYAPNQAREQNVDVAITNAFGFGGQNAVLAFKSFSG